MKSDLWFVGPEQGGGQDADEVYGRAVLWHERGQRETEDLPQYHEGLRKFGVDWTYKIQPTWGCLIKIVLSYNGEAADTESVREFQRTRLGRCGGENCLLELSPLASPSESMWKLDELGFSRAEYESNWIPVRIETLRRRITAHEPRVVLFYGSRQWDQIAGTSFGASRLNGLRIGRSQSTLFAAMPHAPQGLRSLKLQGRGATNSFLEQVGKVLREESSKIMR